MKRQKLELVRIGDREMIPNGRWNDDLILDYIIANGDKKWIKVRDLAKVAFGNGTISSQARVRHYLHRLHRKIIDRGHLLVVITNKRRAVEELKLCDYTSPLEVKLTQERLQLMFRRKQMTGDAFQRATELFQKHIPTEPDGRPSEF
jgi:hypothetical protein